jgi:hypothetical protein
MEARTCIIEPDKINPRPPTAAIKTRQPRIVGRVRFAVSRSDFGLASHIFRYPA